MAAKAKAYAKSQVDDLANAKENAAKEKEVEAKHVKGI